METCGNCLDSNLYEIKDWVEEQQKKHEVYSDICDRSAVENKIQETEGKHYRLGYKIALKDVLRHIEWM